MSNIPNKIMPDEEPITEDNALKILIEILSSYPVWNKEPRVEICCRVLRDVILEEKEKIRKAIEALTLDS
jgi:hypothetical protein